MKVRWEFLRKGSKFERTVKSRDPLLKKIISYPELNEIFGDEWIETQKNLGFFPFIHQRLADLESSITDVKHLSGFNKWVTNITSNPLEYSGKWGEYVPTIHGYSDSEKAVITDKLSYHITADCKPNVSYYYYNP